MIRDPGTSAVERRSLRDDAVLFAVLCAIVVAVAALTGGDAPTAGLALGLFVAASSWGVRRPRTQADREARQ